MIDNVSKSTLTILYFSPSQVFHFKAQVLHVQHYELQFTFKAAVDYEQENPSMVDVWLNRKCLYRMLAIHASDLKPFVVQIDSKLNRVSIWNNGCMKVTRCVTDKIKDWGKKKWQRLLVDCGLTLQLPAWNCWTVCSFIMFRTKPCTGFYHSWSRANEKTFCCV